MKRFRHILAPTDLSSESLSTVQYAAHLATAQDARLTVLHVPQVSTLMFAEFAPPLDLVALDREVANSAREKLESWVRRHVKPEENARVMVRGGLTHEIICKVAEELGTSVIVMSTHGRKGLGHMLLGSVTERVLRDAPCPVLVVRPPAPAVKASKAA